MPDENINNQIQQRDEAMSSLPKPYKSIDSEFLERYKKPIDALKKFYKDKGGIHLLSAENDDETAVICKVPDSAIIDKSRKQVERLSSRESDNWLVTECLLYPSPQEFNEWLNHGKSGLGSTYAGQLLKLARYTTEVSAKKL